ncbi:MAG: ribose 5-phosphate isomerase B [Calditrichaceae bacterium]
MKKLIREFEIVTAAKLNKVVFIDKNTIITPLAKDTARELGVEFKEYREADVTALNRSEKVTESWPVKKIAIAADHGGYYLKEEIKEFLRKMDYAVSDLGPMNADPCDYPDYAVQVARMVSTGEAERGIMIDSVGIGSSMAANRVRGVLAAKCNNAFEARSCREHNFANVLTMGSKVIGSEVAKEIVKVFLETPGGAERHKRRIDKILAMDNGK